MYFSWTLFVVHLLDIQRKYVGSDRNVCKEPRIRFYRLVGRVRTLRVLARRLGALTRGASCDERIVPLGDYFGNKN